MSVQTGKDVTLFLKLIVYCEADMYFLLLRLKLAELSNLKNLK